MKVKQMMEALMRLDPEATVFGLCEGMIYEHVGGMSVTFELDPQTKDRLQGRGIMMFECGEPVVFLVVKESTAQEQELDKRKR